MFLIHKSRDLWCILWLQKQLALSLIIHLAFPPLGELTHIQSFNHIYFNHRSFHSKYFIFILPKGKEGRELGSNTFLPAFQNPNIMPPLCFISQPPMVALTSVRHTRNLILPRPTTSKPLQQPQLERSKLNYLSPNARLILKLLNTHCHTPLASLIL